MDRFPEARFDDLSTVQQTVPSFWTDTYGGQDFIADLLRAMTVQQRQLDQTNRELFDSMGRLTCPVYHQDIWLPVELSEADGEQAGVLDDADPSWQFPVNVDVVSASLLADRLVDPAVMMSAGQEFLIEPRSGLLVFARNPFFDDRFTPFADQDGVRKIRCYLFNAQRDWRYLSTLYGTPAGLILESSPRYRDFLNAILDGISTGTAMSHVYNAIEAATDVPFAGGGETVEAVVSDQDGQLVITDQNVYRFHEDATILVSVGDELSVRQAIADVVTVDEIGSTVPAGLDSLTIGNELLMPSISPLGFANAETPLVVTQNVSGFTKVSFSLTGNSTHAAAFFTEMHSRGVANNATLANYLDVRESPTTEPAAINLPATINPLEFLIENVLRGSVLLVRIKTATVGPNAIGVDKIANLRTIMPPHAALLTIES